MRRLMSQHETLNDESDWRQEWRWGDRSLAVMLLNGTGRETFLKRAKKKSFTGRKFDTQSENLRHQWSLKSDHKLRQTSLQSPCWWCIVWNWKLLRDSGALGLRGSRPGRVQWGSQSTHTDATPTRGFHQNTTSLSCVVSRRREKPTRKKKLEPILWNLLSIKSMIMTM